MEEKLKRLIELRGKDELAEDEQEELRTLENKVEKAFEDTGNDGGLTDDDLQKVVDRIVEATADKTETEEDRDINANANTDTDIEVGEPRVSDWQKRAVRYFDGLATMKDDSVQGREIISNLKQDVQQMSDRQYIDENKEALELIRNAGLSRSQQSRLIYGLDIETRLHTTSTTDTPKAGYLLPKPFLAEVFVIIEQYGLARQLLRGVPMNSKDLDLKNVSTKVVASWVTEGNRITDDDLVLAEGQLSVEKLAGLTSWTTELQEDMAISLLPLVSEQFGESISKKEDQAAFLGDGTASYGNMTGIANLSSVQQYDMGSGDTAASAVDESDLRSAKNQLSEARQQGAVWIMHRTIKDLIEQLENSAGYRIFQENISGNGPDTLLGHPIYTSEVMPASGSVNPGDPFIIFGNPTRSLMGMRRGLTADVSREAVIADASGAVTFNAFQMDGALLRLTERVGFKTPSAHEDAFATVATAAA